MTRRSLLTALLSATAVPAFSQFASFAPRVAPPLDFISQRGERIRLGDSKGKVVILEFLLTTCPHCQDSSRLLSKLQSEFGVKGFQALGVAIDDGAGFRLPDYTAKYATNFPVGVKDHGFAANFLQLSMMQRMLMPQIVIIDRKGMIREQYAGDAPWHTQAEANMRKSITALLGLPPVAPARKAAPKAGNKNSTK